MVKKHRAHRVDTNIYEYRGFQIECVGYYPPDHRVVWEAVDHDRSCFAHAYTLKECKMWVDEELDKENSMEKEEIIKTVNCLYNKTIASDIEPIKYEDIPKKLGENLSKCLKKNVTVNGTGLDGKDMIVTIEK